MEAPATLALALVLTAPALVGCVGDAGEAGGGSDPGPAEAPEANETWGRALPDEVTGLEAVGSADGVEAGSGLAVHGDFAYVSGQNSGFYVVNVTEPADPTVAGRVTGQYTRDVDLLHYPNRTVAALATNGDGMLFADVTDPTSPEIVGEVLTDALVHNLGVVPDTHLVYSARSTGEQVVDVVDASDPAEPEVVETLDRLACHDVSFGPEAEWAFCPAHAETQIWNITNPREPETVARIHNPSIQIHHWATITPERDLLLIGDEFAGSTDAAAGCLAAADTPAGTRSDPVGAVWFYDVSDPSSPAPVGWVAPPAPVDNAPPAPCTAHFGEILPGRDKVVIGWRAAGTVLVDFSDPAQPEILDQAVATGDNWDTDYYRGYLFNGDTARGFDVTAPTG